MVKQHAIKKAALEQNGFGLIQLVLVIIIIGILSYFSVGFFRGQRTLLTANANELAQALRFARHHALSTESSVRITFNTTSGSTTFTSGNGITDLNLPATNSPVYSITNSLSMSLSNIPNHYLIFDHNGVPYVDNSGTELVLTADVTLSDANSSESIDIEPSSGLIRSPS